MTRRVGALIAVLVALAGCTSTPSRASTGALLPDVGSGYHVGTVSGPLSKNAFAAATAVRKDAMTSYLRGAGWRDGAERVWTSASDGFVTDIVATFASAAAAAGVVQLAGRTLPGAATRAFSLSALPSARGFVQTSAVAGKTMFCVIAFASSGTRAFVVTRCTPYPQDTTTVSRLLERQLTRR